MTALGLDSLVGVAAASWQYVAIYLLKALVLWAIVLAVYRRYFHPLSKIPGPFLPAVTRLYIWYYSVIQEGQFYKHIERWHETYGPVIRIAPNEIHLSKISDHEKLFAVGTKFTKDREFYDALGVDVMFSTVSNELHRRRRAPLNAFFSRASVLRLEDLVQDMARKMCNRVAAAIEAGMPVNLGAAARAFSVDVITEYAFDRSWGQLDRDDFGVWWSDAVRGASIMTLNFQQWPLLRKFFAILPERVGEMMDDGVAKLLTLTKTAKQDVLQTRKNMNSGIKPGRYTIFHTLLESNPSPNDKNILDYCSGEAFSIVGAAADTAGNAIGLAAFNVMTHPDIYHKLRAELIGAFPDLDKEMPLIELENLPYLTGVVKEGLRLSYGVLSRLARSVPQDGETFQGYFVPGGTTVSVSTWVFHRNKDVFPDPDTFDPTRWQAPAEVLREREKWLVSFSRGTRGCIGQNLAMCELYVALATLFRRFGALEAHHCGPEDMTYVEAISAFHPRHARPFYVV